MSLVSWEDMQRCCCGMDLSIGAADADEDICVRNPYHRIGGFVHIPSS